MPKNPGALQRPPTEHSSVNTVRPLRIRQRIHWPDLERELLARPGWRREGRELHGPCPFCGGRRRCWAQPGASVDILFQCRECDAPFGDLLAAVGLHGRNTYRDSVVQEPDTYTRPHSHPTKPLDHLIALWEFGEPVERNTPGGRYLAQRTGCAVVPPSVRWCHPDRWPRRKGIRPLPVSAAGALLYRFTSPSDPAAAVVALQIEAVNLDGSGSVWFEAAPNEHEPRKRPNVGGSLMTGRALVVRHGDSAGGVHVVEGPIDALAVVQVLGLQTLRRTGDTVIGAPGTSGFSVQTVASYTGPVTLWPDGDDGGYLAAMRLTRALRRLRRVVALRAAPAGTDWVDVARALTEEREARRATE